jgi:hypothetical protein
MVEFAARRRLRDRAEVAQDHLVHAAAHPVFPERHMGFEAFPMPVIGEPEIEDGLRIMVWVMSLNASRRCAHHKKEGLNRSSGQVQQGGNEVFLNQQPQVAL